MEQFKNILKSSTIVIFLQGLYTKALVASESYNSIWGILSVVAIYSVIAKYEQLKNNIQNKSKKLLIVIAGAIALKEVVGIYLIRGSSIIAYGKRIGIQVASVFVLLYLTYMILVIVWDILSGNNFIINDKSIVKAGKKYFCVDFCIIIIMWLPVLLAYYPGIFAYDASNQVCQVVNESYCTYAVIR